MVVSCVTNRQNDFYSTTISTEFSSYELSFIAAYGEPTIQVGGTITYNSSFTYVKNAALILIRSQFPINFGLSHLTDTDAIAKVDAWTALMLTNLQAALDALLALTVPMYPSTVVHTLHH